MAEPYSMKHNNTSNITWGKDNDGIIPLSQINMHTTNINMRNMQNASYVISKAITMTHACFSQKYNAYT